MIHQYYQQNAKRSSARGRAKRLFLLFLTTCLIGVTVLVGLQGHPSLNCGSINDREESRPVADTFMASHRDIYSTMDDTISPRDGRTNSIGVVYTLGLKTPLITQYTKSSAANGGRRPYLDEIAQSIASLKQHSKIEVALITDTIDLPENFTGMFSTIIPFDSSHVKGGWGDKIVALPLSPFDYTMFLDADVHICSNFDHIFKVLDFVDLAFVLEQETKFWQPVATERLMDAYINNIPKYMFNFLHANSGMLLFRKNPQVLEFFSEWQKIHERESLRATESVGDQFYLPYILWNSKLRFLPLPPNYNLRFHDVIAPVPLRNEVYIVHSRTRVESDCSVINRNLSYRLQDPVRGAKMVSEIFQQL